MTLTTLSAREHFPHCVFVNASTRTPFLRHGLEKSPVGCDRECRGLESRREVGPSRHAKPLANRKDQDTGGYSTDCDHTAERCELVLKRPTAPPLSLGPGVRYARTR